MILTELNQALKLYVDDIRNPKGQGWTVVRNYDEKNIQAVIDRYLS